MKRNSKPDWDSVFLNAKRGNFDSIPSDIKVRCYSNLKKIEKDNLVCKDSSDSRGVWIHGPLVQVSLDLLVNNILMHILNYAINGGMVIMVKNVIMDDFGKEHYILGYHLKIWADRYGCVLETKGGASASSFDKFVVTSQYSIEEIWNNDNETIDAIKRRFKIIRLDNNLSLYSDILI